MNINYPLLCMSLVVTNTAFCMKLPREGVNDETLASLQRTAHQPSYEDLVLEDDRESPSVTRKKTSDLQRGAHKPAYSKQKITDIDHTGETLRVTTPPKKKK